ncbi:hypothetical protein H2O64_15020 [Kordia sp. YSTF-M3]|uniref:Uncharacterized protein n=1 Tax=Kordia aestuariivivens TaxID=2759037 RepID=A0ABR7QBU8_9FLAO|nr:hypothetical protein [Kordia aestuariivivens]MBC8755988.1 hypothetical protein [Kordia aestuariivivens]
MIKLPYLLTGYLKPIRLRLLNSKNVIKIDFKKTLNLNFTTHKNAVQILMDLPTIKMKRNHLHTKPHLNIRLSTKLEVFSVNQVLKNQSSRLLEFLEEHKEVTKQQTINNYKNYRNNV